MKGQSEGGIYLEGVGIFDWWRIEKQNRYTLKEEAKREQGDLEEELDYVIGGVLKRFNHFDFKTVDSDILGHVYEDYLPKVERKKLGEYYNTGRSCAVYSGCGWLHSGGR